MVSFYITIDIFLSKLMKTLIKKFNFMYYMNSPFHHKQAIEILNLYFKDIPYYAFFTDLKYNENKEKLEEIYKYIKEVLNKNKTFEKFVIVIFDNAKVIYSLY
jgi:hypothetical protein